MNLQQQYTKTWEQKTRSKFNLQQINLSLNLKKQMSEFQQNPSNPSLSRVTWEQQ